MTVTGLDADTTYFYTIGTGLVRLAGGDADHYFSTSPLEGTAKPTRIWILGDPGNGDANAEAVRDAYYNFNGGPHTDLVITLGDNAYPDGTDADYQTTFFDIYPLTLRNSTLWPAIGNHDATSSNPLTQIGPYFAMFSLPKTGQAGGVGSGTESYYSFDYANLHFVVLDSHASDRSPTGAMLSWLEADLADTVQDWVIAYWHHPPYSKGGHDSDTELRPMEMRQNVVPILDDHGVDLTFTGHSHSFERSLLIDGHYGLSTTLTGSMILNGSDGRLAEGGPYEKLEQGPRSPQRHRPHRLRLGRPYVRWPTRPSCNVHLAQRSRVAGPGRRRPASRRPVSRRSGRRSRSLHDGEIGQLHRSRRRWYLSDSRQLPR